MQQLSEIWDFPQGGAVPDLGDLLNARDIEALWDASESAQVAALSAIEGAGERALENARAMSTELKKQGIDFDVDRMMRPSILERFLIWYDEVVFSIRGLFTKENDQPSLTEAFPFSLTLAMTVPTREIGFEYDEIFGETERFRREIGAAISASRGQPPMQVKVDDDVLEDIYESDDWSEDDSLLAELGDVVAYWPPAMGKPALALAETQMDGGEPIEIRLLGQDEAGHDRMLEALGRHGGTL